MTRVAGHGLQHEGRPVLRAGCCGNRDEHGRRNAYDVIGHGLCACGDTSPCLDTTAARRRWHREHKELVKEGRIFQAGTTQGLLVRPGLCHCDSCQDIYRRYLQLKKDKKP